MKEDLETYCTISLLGDHLSGSYRLMVNSCKLELIEIEALKKINETMHDDMIVFEKNYFIKIILDELLLIKDINQMIISQDDINSIDNAERYFKNMIENICENEEYDKTTIFNID